MLWEWARTKGQITAHNKKAYYCATPQLGLHVHTQSLIKNGTVSCSSFTRIFNINKQRCQSEHFRPCLEDATVQESISDYSHRARFQCHVVKADGLTCIWAAALPLSLLAVWWWNRHAKYDRKVNKHWNSWHIFYSQARWSWQSARTLTSCGAVLDFW